MRWVRNGKSGESLGNMTGKAEGERMLGTGRRWRGDNIKMHVKMSDLCGQDSSGAGWLRDF